MDNTLSIADAYNNLTYSPSLETALELENTLAVYYTTSELEAAYAAAQADFTGHVFFPAATEAFVALNAFYTAYGA